MVVVGKPETRTTCIFAVEVEATADEEVVSVYSRVTR